MHDPVLTIEWIKLVSGAPNDKPKEDGPPDIQLNDLSFGSDQTVVIAGHNGSGKTTVLETLFGLRREYEYSVSFLGAPLGDSHAKNRLEIGVCFQRQTFNEVVRVSDIITLHNSIYAPDSSVIPVDFLKVDELAGKKYGSLSGGEQQRVNLYFSLAHDPLLFVADEPEKGLDESTLNATRKHLDDRTRRSKTNLIASHNSSLFGIAHRFLLMDSGQLTFDGPVDEAMSHYLGKTSWEMKINADNIDEGMDKIHAKAPEGIFRKVTENRIIAYRIDADEVKNLEALNLVSAVESRKNKASELVVITEKRDQ